MRATALAKRRSSARKSMFNECTPMYTSGTWSAWVVSRLCESFSALPAQAGPGARLAEGVADNCSAFGARRPVMTLWKRWSSGFVASIDSVISQVENHEAQVASALRELERGVLRSK